MTSKAAIDYALAFLIVCFGCGVLVLIAGALITWFREEKKS